MTHHRLHKQIQHTLTELYSDSQNDHLRMLKGVAKSMFRPVQPSDFKDVYLSISQEQGAALTQLIKKHKLRHIVEFGTSFGISTLFLAYGALETNGHIITTELIESKARQAMHNFERAGVQDLIEVRIGDALETLKHHQDPIDLLLLDGWKDLYLPLFRMLEPCFHPGTLIYVDNADMAEVQAFLEQVVQTPPYRLRFTDHGKVGLITLSS